MKYLVIALCVGTAIARPDGAGHGGHHDHGHHAAAAPAAPQTGYQEPSASYSEPASGYEQPSAYAAAPSGYEQPAYDSGYEATAGGYSGYGAVEEPSSGFDLNIILIPILIIAGLALLFPSIITVPVNDTGRRKRSAEDEVSGNSLVDRVQDIYMAVVESEECMERIACEVGGIAADAGVSKNIFVMAEAVTPVKYSKMMKKFSSGKDCHKMKCGAF